MRSNSLDKELKMKQMELMIKMKEKSDSEEVSTLDPLLLHILLPVTIYVVHGTYCHRQQYMPGFMAHIVAHCHR